MPDTLTGSTNAQDDYFRTGLNPRFVTRGVAAYLFVKHQGGKFTKLADLFNISPAAAGRLYTKGETFITENGNIEKKLVK